MSAKTEPTSPISDDAKPSTPPKQKRKPGNATPSSSAKKSKSSPATGTMTPDIKEALINHMMRIACSAVRKDQLAAELGITKKQLDNAICSGRVNLRSKLVKAARDFVPSSAACAVRDAHF